jgi:hypothetical protein
MDEQGDLSHLADIVVPPPVAWWPPALGWWILAATLLAALGILAGAAVRRHRRNAYRRAALAELGALGPVSDAAGAAAVSAILKRTALVAYPRADVASLTGSGWLAFLDRTAAGNDFTRGSASGIAKAPFGAPLCDSAAIAAAARRWLNRHRAQT